MPRRNRKRRVFPDDEDEDNDNDCDNDSTTAASDAAAVVRDRQASLSRFSDEDGESSRPPSLCSDQARTEGVVGNGNQAGWGQEGAGKCDGLRHRESESGTAYRGKLARDGDDDKGGAKGVDAEEEEEEDETDEELTGGTCGTTLEEEDLDTDVEVEKSMWDRTGDRLQPQEEDGEIDADGEGKDVGNRLDDVTGSSRPPVNEVPSRNAQQIEPNGERASAEERIYGAGAVHSDFAPPSPVLRVPPTIQV